VIAALLLLACSNEQAIEEEAAEVVQAMEAHWDDAQDMRDAALAGDQEAYRKAATSLHDRMPLDGLAETLAPMQQALKDAAAEARSAQGADAMGKSLGAVVGACGQCHEAAKVQPQLDPVPPPPVEGAEPALEMLWHQLAGIDLWSAVVRHDAKEWEEGVGKLEKATFVVDDGTATGAELDAIEKRLQALAAKAHSAESTPARAEVYGRITATCVACHEAAKAGDTEGVPGGEAPKKRKKGKKK